MTTSPHDARTGRPGSGRIGPWLAGLWLFFLLEPLTVAWRDRTEVRGVLGLSTVVAFGVVYLALWFRARADRRRLVATPPLAVGCGFLGVLLVLSIAMVVLLGEPGLASAVYVAVACALVLPRPAAAVAVVVVAAVVLGSGPLQGWGSQSGVAVGVLTAALAVFGLRMVMVRNIELFRAQEENARLAVETERLRFARDLHDILGHSLTVMTVKAELLRRTLDVDLERARTEAADLERLARDALADVRRAVEGYRELTLPGELARARAALASAEIEADLPNATDEVPGALRELFAWTVREGVTNVIRHSGATSCAVRLDATAAEIRDDGRGSGGRSSAGSGLSGLRERAAASGAAVTTRDLQPGFSLRVVAR